MARLTGKIALVSGGAGGMGATHARGIIENGGQVVIGDLLDKKGELLAEELGDGAVYTHLDVTSDDDWRRAVDLTVSTFGGLNVLVNNAGVMNVGPLGAYSRSDWDAILAVNLTGPFLGITAARDALVAAAPASIVNISSTAGMEGMAGMHGYVSSKFGLRGLTKSVALELGALGVRCNSVHPGVVATRLTAGQPVEVMFGPLGRIGAPEEVSNLVVYLASDESSFSTGAESSWTVAGSPARSSTRTKHTPVPTPPTGGPMSDLIQTDAESVVTTRSDTALLMAVGLGALVVSLSQSVLVPVLPTLPARLNTSASTASWLLTSTLLVSAVAVPIMGRLGDMFGRRRLLLVAVAALVVGSWSRP